MLISQLFQFVLLFVNPTIGLALSNLYIQLATLLFHATSYAHTYKYHVHSVLRVIVSQLLYCVPFAQHCANVAFDFHVQ